MWSKCWLLHKGRKKKKLNGLNKLVITIKINLCCTPIATILTKTPVPSEEINPRSWYCHHHVLRIIFLKWYTAYIFSSIFGIMPQNCILQIYFKIFFLLRKTEEKKMQWISSFPPYDTFLKWNILSCFCILWLGRNNENEQKSGKPTLGELNFI